MSKNQPVQTLIVTRPDREDATCSLVYMEDWEVLGFEHDVPYHVIRQISHILYMGFNLVMIHKLEKDNEPNSQEE